MIEDLLRWAYRQELPKRELQASAVKSFLPSGYGGSWNDGMTVVENRHGVVVDPTLIGTPHADAVALSAAVFDLDKWTVEIPEEWNPVADLGLSEAETTVAVEQGLSQVFDTRPGMPVRLRRPLSVLVRHHALMGDCPSWEAEAPERKPVCGANGKPSWFRKVARPFRTIGGQDVVRDVEEEGRNPVSRRPYPDAYQKTRLDPDPYIAVAWRAEYELWVLAISALVGMANEVMTEHVATPSPRSIRPWETGIGGGPSILPDLTRGRAQGPERGGSSAKVLRFQPVSIPEPERTVIVKPVSKRRRRRSG